MEYNEEEPVVQNNKIELTKEEYEQLKDDNIALKLQVQQLQDVVEDSISGINILSNAIATRNIRDNAITGDKIIASAITTEKLSAGSITAAKIAVGTITSDQIEDGTIAADDIKAGTITGNKIAAGTIESANIAAGTIVAGNIAAGTVTADEITVTSLQSLSQNCGTLTAGSISGITITGSLFNVGSTSQGYINFALSGIKFYDAGSQYLKFYKSGYSSLDIILGSGFNGIRSSGILLLSSGSTYGFALYGTGEIQYPLLTSAPTGAKGRFTYNSSDDYPVFHNASAWRHWIGVSGW